MQCCANDWRAIIARSVRTNEWRTISVYHVRTNEWRMVSARHVVVDVMSRRARSCGETRMDNGLRGCCRNTINHIFITNANIIVITEQHKTPLTEIYMINSYLANFCKGGFVLFCYYDAVDVSYKNMVDSVPSIASQGIIHSRLTAPARPP